MLMRKEFSFEVNFTISLLKHIIQMKLDTFLDVRKENDYKLITRKMTIKYLQTDFFFFLFLIKKK